MRKIHEILRLHAAGLSARQMASSVGAARSSIGDCLRRAALAGVTWPLPPDCDEAELERRLYPPAAHSSQARPAVDFAEVQRQLRQRGVTLALLWQEYKERFPDGFQYSRYCELYRAWLARVDVVMRQARAWLTYNFQGSPALQGYNGIAGAAGSIPIIRTLPHTRCTFYGRRSCVQ